MDPFRAVFDSDQNIRHKRKLEFVVHRGGGLDKFGGKKQDSFGERTSAFTAFTGPFSLYFFR